jgi:hypothetical protein
MTNLGVLDSEVIVVCAPLLRGVVKIFRDCCAQPRLAKFGAA